MTNSGGRFFVGNIGSTGTATGPHIHKYVKDLKTGSYIDPSTIKSALTGIQIGEKRNSFG
jgi:murein DD-endopeptidase MepM/ murein hydrolase activator NlpD